MTRARLVCSGVVAAGLAVAAAAACFSERTAGLTISGACQVPVSVIDSQHVVVSIRDFLFRPDSIRVAPGTTVTWIDCEDPGVEAHTTTSDSPGWDSGRLTSGGRFSHTFPAPGSFPYTCTTHSTFMFGKVVVQ